MSCWVAPTVAAEIWGVSVQQVMERIAAGSFPCKVELGFTVVDIAPGCFPKPPRPDTFKVVEHTITEPDEPLGWAQKRRSVGSSRRRPEPVAS